MRCLPTRCVVVLMQEFATLAARRRALLRQHFSQWLARSSVLPAVELRRQTVLAGAFRRWVAVHQARVHAQAARAFVLRTLLTDALRTWRGKTAYRAEIRAIQRMGHARRRASDLAFHQRLAFVAPTQRFAAHLQ